jgi:hypothetical protein
MPNFVSNLQITKNDSGILTPIYGLFWECGVHY